ncbi:unnamed protein product, partial [Choristocarpus tenellus]
RSGSSALSHHIYVCVCVHDTLHASFLSSFHRDQVSYLLMGLLKQSKSRTRAFLFMNTIVPLCWRCHHIYLHLTYSCFAYLPTHIPSPSASHVNHHNPSLSPTLTAS